MLSRHTIRITVAVGVAIPVLLVPPGLLAQSHPAGATDPHAWIDSALKWWGVLSVFVIGALQLWVRAIVRDHVDAQREASAKALLEHDTNPSAHANHKNPAKYASEIGEVKAALGQVQIQGAVILEKIKSGQETNAEWRGMLDAKLETLDAKLGGITALDHRLSKIEGEHVAIHNLRDRGRS